MHQRQPSEFMRRAQFILGRNAVAFPGKATCEAAVRFLLGVKLVISAWNAWFTHDRTYDRADHLFRATHSLWTMEGHSYDPPLYYVPAYLFRQLAPKAATAENLIRLMRVENFAILVMGYLCWLYVIIPGLFRNWRSRVIASVLLLALPTYQKVAQLAHPDNLHFGLASAALAAWMLLWRGRRVRPSRSNQRNWLPKLVALSVLIGTTGMTRPFAAVSVLLLWGATMTLIAVRWGEKRKEMWRDMIIVSAIAGTLSSSWFVYRKLETGVIGGTYDDVYIQKYAPHRASVRLVRYFTTFYFGALLTEPNRDMAALDKRAKTPFQSKYGNSFPTIAYSEFWGDHWCYFSGAASKDTVWSEEEKRWPKRVLFVVALPLSLLLAVRFFPSVVFVAARARVNWQRHFPSLLLIAYLLLGTAMFVWWQAGAGMTPGKNSSIKALYNAHLIAPLVLVPLLKPLGQHLRTPVMFWILLTLAVSLPVAMFWPQW